MHSSAPILVATFNPGKLRELRDLAGESGVLIESVPNFQSISPAVESGTTFEQNARIKAEYYSRYVPGRIVVAEDSGLSVDALEGAPGIFSARYAAVLEGATASQNSSDEANNRALITQLERLSGGPFAGKYVCVIAAAQDGRTLATFEGQTQGQVLTRPRGQGGFGYDPLFYFPQVGQTFAELPPEEKARHSHRGKAFRQFLPWYKQNFETARSARG